jgi:malate-CoA ligase subunit beta
VAYTADQAVYVATELGGWHWAVKAQIHSGARGKAGGVKLCRTYHEVAEAAKAMLGTCMVTTQTGPAGKMVSRVYVEMAEPFDREIYLGFVLDRKAERIRVIASGAGRHGDRGDRPRAARHDPAGGGGTGRGPAALPGAADRLRAGLNLKQVSQAVATMLGCYRAFRDLDATMVEINPLVVTKDDRVLALDAKMSSTTTRIFRRAQIAEMRDVTQEDPREAQANQRGLNYVGLDGDIGCIINGAGLAMATMDMIKYAGGEPANFLDVGGGASPERVKQAFDLVLSDKACRRSS